MISFYLSYLVEAFEFSDSHFQWGKQSLYLFCRKKEYYFLWGVGVGFFVALAMAERLGIYSRGYSTYPLFTQYTEYKNTYTQPIRYSQNILNIIIYWIYIYKLMGDGYFMLIIILLAIIFAVCKSWFSNNWFCENSFLWRWAKVF